MATETEIKLRIVDIVAIRIALDRCGARPARSAPHRVHEMNVLFDTKERSLAAAEQLLRIRTETVADGSGGPRASRRVVLTFKRPVAAGADPVSSTTGDRATRFKEREELEVTVSDESVLTKMVEALGLREFFRYEKYRTTFELPESLVWSKGLLIELDETPIGTFLELEGPQQVIDRAAGELGFSEQDYVQDNYLTLYRKECRKRGVQPLIMTFAAASSTKG